MTKKNNKLRLFFFLLIISATAGYAFASQAREMTEYPRVKLQTLDKVTAHTMTFDARVGATLKFGPLYIKVLSCQKSSPIDEPESAAFVQVWEPEAEEDSQWVFSGWMFASSPGLSPMDHPIYDVWVIDCLEDDEQKADTEEVGDTLEAEEQPPKQDDLGDMLEE